MGIISYSVFPWPGFHLVSVLLFQISGWSGIVSVGDGSSMKIHKCPICSKITVSEKQLTIHMRSHTGEKPFKCSFCGKGFSQRGSLNRHEKIHCSTEEKLFVCGICGMEFTNIGDRDTHLVSHRK